MQNTEDIIVHIPRRDYSTRYVGFAKDGSIVSISSTKPATPNFLTLHVSEIVNILSGAEDINQYYVVSKKGKHTLAKKFYKEIIHTPEEPKRTTPALITLDDTIEGAELTVTWCLKKKNWQFTFSKDALAKVNSDTILKFFVVAEGDFDYIVRPIDVVNAKKSKKVTVPFVTTDEEEYTAIKLVTVSFFNTYRLNKENE